MSGIMHRHAAIRKNVLFERPSSFMRALAAICVIAMVGCEKDVSLTPSVAEHTLRRWDGAVTGVTGVQMIPAENVAHVDFQLQFFVFQYNNGPSGLRNYAYSGPAEARFASYTDGRWALKEVIIPAQEYSFGSSISWNLTLVADLSAADRADPLFAIWEPQEPAGFASIALAPDGTFAQDLGTSDQWFGTYRRVDPMTLELKMFPDYDLTNIETERVQIAFDNGNLLLSAPGQQESLALEKSASPVPETFRPALADAVANRDPQQIAIKNQIIDTLSFYASYKLAIGEFHQNFDRFPKNNLEAGVEGYHRYELATASVTPKNGEVKITFSDAADQRLKGNSLYLIPKAENGRVDWKCYSDPAIADFQVRSCKEVLP